MPDDKLAEARALTSPLPNSHETAAQGKAIYDGKVPASGVMGKMGTVMGLWPPV